MDITCRKATELVSESMHRRLSPYEKLKLRLHLMICSACRRYRRQVLAIRDAMASRPDEADALLANAGEDERLSADARARIAESLRGRDGDV